jgi:hypothetical protein
VSSASRRRHDRGGERGIALLLALFLTAAASALGASMMYLSQTETYASNNYRVMTQARYGAEAGVHRAINYLLTTYTPPTAAELAANFVTTVSPVTSNGEPVVLSANDEVESNYPDADELAAFENAVGGTLVADHVNIEYAPSARLMSARNVNGTIVMGWEITSVGRIDVGAATAEVEVSAVLERQVTVTAQTVYAAFATSGGCGALKFAGNAATNSYDSTAALVNGSPVLANSGGNVGTNGNLTESGNAVINGTLSTPRVGVGACSSGNVNASTSSGNATVTGGIVQLPQSVTVPTPDPPNPAPPTTNFDGDGQTLLDGASVGNLTLSNNASMTLGAVGVTSVINVNSFKLSANSNVTILGTVILNVMGAGDTSPVALTGNSVSTGTFDPSKFKINYAGTGTINIAGNGALTGVINAPNAALKLAGNGHIYGALIGATIEDLGNAQLHFDRNLQTNATTTEIGNHMLSSFSWKKY